MIGLVPDEFRSADVLGAGTALSRSPGGGVKHTGTAGISGRREAAAGPGTAGMRSRSQLLVPLPLPPLPPLVFLVRSLLLAVP